MWLEERKAELLPVPYFHVVYTLPAPISDLAYTNKAVLYDILFKASAEATIRIAADKKRLGARIGITSVLHTWGSAMTHHPHVHMIVPGGGLSEDGNHWIACRHFHRIRHYGLLANGNRADYVAKARELLALPPPLSQPEPEDPHDDAPRIHPLPCPCCGGRMLLIEVFAPGETPQHSATPNAIRIDTSSPRTRSAQSYPAISSAASPPATTPLSHPEPIPRRRYPHVQPFYIMTTHGPGLSP